MAALTAAVAIVGAVTSFVGQRNQAKAASKNARIQDEQNAKLVANSKEQEKLRQENLRRENDRKRRENIRAFLRSRGDTLGGAANRGALGSSGVAGALAGGGAEFASNAGNITRGELLAQEFGFLNNEAADIKSVANLASSQFQERSARNQQVIQFGNALFSNAKTIGGFAGTAASSAGSGFVTSSSSSGFSPFNTGIG